MRTILTIILAVMTYISASAYKYNYSFSQYSMREMEQPITCLGNWGSAIW